MAERFPGAGTAADIAAAVRSGEVSAEEVCRLALDRAEGTGRELGAFLEIDRERSLAEARRVDAERLAGRDPGELAGVPVAVKDNIAMAGWSLTCGSRFLERFRSPFDATAWERLRRAGAVALGRTNMDEFGMGSSNENSAFHPVSNPHDRRRVPGGSSGGSAAAVAAGIVPLALGSDTGGSVRQPAAFCGTFGFKPTWGRISRWGLVAFGSSLDQVGPMSRSARDLATVVRLAAGEDGRDPTALPAPAGDVLGDAPRSLAGLKIGVPREARGEGLSPAVAAMFDACLARLAGAGATVVDFPLPELQDAVAIYYIVSGAEASSNLSRFDGVRYGRRASGAASPAEMWSRSRAEGFGAEVKRRILTGAFVLSSGWADRYYLEARRARGRLEEAFAGAFRDVDLVATPTVPAGPFRQGEKIDDPLALYLGDVFTTPASLAGLPAVACPSGKMDDGLPGSLQLIGPAGADGFVLAAASAWEELMGGPAPLAGEAA